MIRARKVLFESRANGTPSAPPAPGQASAPPPTTTTGVQPAAPGNGVSTATADDLPF